MNTLKETIKELAAGQSALKNQKKTVNLQGVRTMPTYVATNTHKNNRETLRCLYMAYGLLRGKTENEIEPNSKTPICRGLVDKFLKQYEHEFKHNELLPPNGLEHICTSNSNENGGTNGR